MAAPEIDCIWICGPNHARVENMERIVDALRPRGGARRHRLREAARRATSGEARRMVELVEKAGVLHGYLENQLFSPALARAREIVWARGAALSGPAVPRARRRGAQRPAHAVVLAGRPAGRRRAQRHDVPQPRGRPPSADEARRAARAASARSRSRRRSRRSSGRAPSTPSMLRADDGRGGRLREAAGRGLRARDRALRGRGRPAPDRRGDDVVELRRRRPAAQHGAARPRVLALRATRSTRGPRSSSAAGCAARRARTWSRSRTPSRA